MAEKLENLNKKDLEIILEVNRKAIEIETEAVEQNEEIISTLNELKKNNEDLDKKVEKVILQGEDTNKSLFKIQVLFITGLLSLIIQIIKTFYGK